MKKFIALGACALGTAVVSVAWTKGWDAQNNPVWFSDSYQAHFESLPHFGSIPEERMPWSDTYWPDKEGGITRRWRSSDPVEKTGKRSHAQKLLSFEQLKYTSASRIAELSPAEKYDIFMGRYDYPAYHMERQRIASNNKIKSWEGLCFGWVPAALQNPEPAPVTVVNPDGIEVTFYTSDVTALMSFYYGWASLQVSNGENTGIPQIGWNCQFDRDEYNEAYDDRTRPCQDVNPGSFHLVLENQLGLRREGFAMDVDRWKQTWNQPVVSFTSRIIDKRRSRFFRRDRDARREVRVKTKVTYVAEIGPHHGPVVGTKYQRLLSKEYEYWLELDRNGDIVGGNWISTERPDYLWLRDKVEFTGYFEGIKRIYRKAL